MLAARTFLRKQSTVDMIIDFSIKVCIAKGLADPAESVCPGIVTLMGDVILKMLGDDWLTKDRICNELLGYCSHPVYKHYGVDDFATRVLADKPSAIASDDFVNKLYQEIAADTNARETFKLVHMSDPHIDFDYTPGTNFMCGQSGFCCRPESGYPTDPEQQAKKWGGWECDIPVITLQSMLDHLRDEVKPDFLFWTGDNSPHNTWANTADEVVKYTKFITDALNETFKDEKVKIFPCMGNHDTWPVNVEDYSVEGGNDIIKQYRTFWEAWLGKDGADVFEKWGYYSIDFNDFDGAAMGPDGSKVIALNTQSANTDNWWIFGQRSDPGGVIAWLEAELSAIEKAGGIAYIIGHI